MWINDGDFDAAEASAASKLERRYRTATALHFTLEPANAVAEFVDGRLAYSYTGNQWQSLILPVLAARWRWRNAGRAAPALPWRRLRPPPVG